MTRTAAARTAPGDTVQHSRKAHTISSDATALGVGVLGATGYGGAELIRLLEGHPHASLRAASSRQSAGLSLGSQLPFLPGRDLVLDDDPQDPAAWIDRGVDVVFSALPHGAFAARAGAFLEAGLRSSICRRTSACAMRPNTRGAITRPIPIPRFSGAPSTA